MSRLARRGFLAAMWGATTGSALGRTPTSGVLRLRLPYYFGGLDPHALDDPLSALFAGAIADPLFALDAGGKPYATLASALPERTPRGARLSLRPELTSARGKRLTAADVAFSWKRSQALGGAAVLSAFRVPVADGKDPLSLIVPGADPDELARALANPLTAIVPRSFSPLAPDGTGPFSAALGRGALTLTRNLDAARGASFLDRIEVSGAADLADALRAFESGLTDVGWLGNGLYRPRASAIPLEGPIYGWIVLRTGLDAKTWGAPGIAAQLAAGIPGDALTRFGVRALPRAQDGMRWGGGPSALLVPDDAPHAIELGRALEPLLSTPGNEVHATPTPRSAWLEARHSHHFTLMLDFVRAASLDLTESAQTLLAAADPALAKRPPRHVSSLTDVTRTLPLGILGELRISGARMPEFQGLEAWQLGAVWANSAKL